jgi:imidazolonepropionase-like amidohydrolase
MTPAQAIVVATSRPAEVLRIKDAGTLALGKRGDFIVLGANPLENILNTRTIESVYIYGIKLDRDTLRMRFKKAVVLPTTR